VRVPVRQTEVEEERVQLRDNTSPAGWRPWSVADFYRHHPTSQRVRVHCAGMVNGSTLAPPWSPEVAATLAGGAAGAAGAGAGAAAFGFVPSWREGTLIGHTRCKHPLSGSEWERRKVDTPIMLLCADGSHGLDLSFVTHIFLLGRISDPAIKQQVVARADRMGAVPDADGRGCEVETLLLWHDDELRSPTKPKRGKRSAATIAHLQALGITM
jgi:hypothetical protein